MIDFLFAIIRDISLCIGVIGISIILIGAIRALICFLFKRDKNFLESRLILGTHLILGLDFLVGKDIIDTILLDSGVKFWTDLAGLITVVIIRVILTHFMTREIKDLEKEEAEKNKKKK